MLTSLSLKNFTLFADTTFEFGSHLNVIIGENGLGKTHVLKAAYSLLAVSAHGAREFGSDPPTKTYLQTAIASKLRGVFKPAIGRLTRRQAGRNRSEVGCMFPDKRYDIGFSFHTSSKSDVVVETTPSAWIDDVPVYLPPRELLSIYPGFVSLYETTHLSFEETWRDTSILLGAPLSRGARKKDIQKLVQPLEDAMDGGTVELDDTGRFYLKTKMGRIEMHLVAEGMRKLAMLARLTATGSLLDKGYLFWDEPEANLNPRLIKLIARAILTFCQNGIQVFIATHSLLLLRELYILHHQEFPQTDTRYIGLHPGPDGSVDVIQGMTIDEIGDISSLDEELEQSERYLDVEHTQCN